MFLSLCSLFTSNVLSKLPMNRNTFHEKSQVCEICQILESSRVYPLPKINPGRAVADIIVYDRFPKSSSNFCRVNSHLVLVTIPVDFPAI